MEKVFSDKTEEGIRLIWMQFDPEKTAEGVRLLGALGRVAVGRSASGARFCASP